MQAANFGIKGEKIMKKSALSLIFLLILATTSLAGVKIQQSAASKIGTLTAGKWCINDGNQINCTEDAPAGSGDITAVGSCATGDCSQIGNGASSGGYQDYKEASGNGSDYIRLKAPDSVGTSATVTLPSTAGTLLLTDGNGSGLTGITGSQISNSPSGSIEATTAQAAIDELDTEKMPISTYDADEDGKVDICEDLTLSGITEGDLFYYHAGHTTRLSTVDNCIVGRDGSSNIGCFTNITVGSITSGADPTINAAGKIGIDTTANQLKYYGTAAKVLDPRIPLDLSFKSPASGDKIKFRVPWGFTISSIGCVTDAATSAVLDIQECDSNAANCATVLSTTITCGTTRGTGTVSDSSIASGNYIYAVLGTVTGTPGYVYVDVNGTVTGE
jgi:hypothetical protein